MRFPGVFKDFWETEICQWLEPEVEALLRSLDPSVDPDVRVIFKAADALGVARWLKVTHEGVALNVPAQILTWRRNDSSRIAMEIEALSGMSAAEIAVDFGSLYGVPVDPDEVHTFILLFCDKDAAEHNWLDYCACIGQDEAGFKRKLMTAPRDYMRWKLGVPVELQAEHVLNRFISDGYFTCQQLKIENENPSKDMLVRMKLERETVFKAMDRLTKHREASKNGTGNSAAQAIADAVGRVVLQYEDQEFTSLTDVLKENETDGSSGP